MKKWVSKVAIVGRANVGKSTLFNRLSVDVKSLTFDYAGVTRDTIHDVTCWKGFCFELIDTGGIQIGKTDDVLTRYVSERARNTMNEADVILFVCDGTAGVISADREIAKNLRKINKPVILVINKSDTKIARDYEHEFIKLGFKNTVAISALQGTAIVDLLDALIALLPPQASGYNEQAVVQQKVDFSIVLLGKPNVGKSSLLNLLTKQDHALVADIPGTTREAVQQKVSFYNEDIIVTDTPGIRKKRKIEAPLETMMVKTAFRALDRSDIVLLIVDGSEGTLSDQELKLAFYAFEQGKGLLILFNKQDLVDDTIKQELAFNLESYAYFIDKINTLSISCKTGKNVGRILPLLKEIWQRHNQEFSGQELTVLFKDALVHRPHYHNGQLLQLIYAKQVKAAPITIALRVNHPDWFGSSQQTFLENVMRKKYDLKGVPIKFLIPKK